MASFAQLGVLPFATNRTEPLELVESEHRQHAVVALVIRDVMTRRSRTSLRQLQRPHHCICTELRERFEQFKRRDLYVIHLAALFCDAGFLYVRPNEPDTAPCTAWTASLLRNSSAPARITPRTRARPRSGVAAIVSMADRCATRAG
jgi:hypothetical protein